MAEQITHLRQWNNENSSVVGHSLTAYKPVRGLSSSCASLFVYGIQQIDDEFDDWRSRQVGQSAVDNERPKCPPLNNWTVKGARQTTVVCRTLLQCAGLLDYSVCQSPVSDNSCGAVPDRIIYVMPTGDETQLCNKGNPHGRSAHAAIIPRTSNNPLSTK